MLFATALFGLGELVEALQISFATADGLGWGSVLKRCKFHLQRLMVWVGGAFFSVTNFICNGSFLDWILEGRSPSEQDYLRCSSNGGRTQKPQPLSRLAFFIYALLQMNLQRL